MKRSELDRLLDEETVASEASRDEGPSTRAARKAETRSVVYSVRLTPDQTEQIQRIADDAGIPASGLVREWVLRGLAAERDKPEAVGGLVDALARDVERLRRHLRDEAS